MYPSSYGNARDCEEYYLGELSGRKQIRES